MGDADEQQGQRSHLKLPGVRALPSVGSFGVGGFVGERLNDAVSLLSALPEIGVTLRSINTHIINVDREVTLMRQGVNRIEDDVQGLRSDIEQLREEIRSVNLNVEQMGARLESMEPNIESLGRLAGLLRLGRRRSRDSGPDELGAGAAYEPGDGLEPDSDLSQSPQKRATL